MALARGQQLGVSEVRDLIGAGGMGEVYRGLDTKLNRHVAIEILPDTLAAAHQHGLRPALSGEPVRRAGCSLAPLRPHRT